MSEDAPHVIAEVEAGIAEITLNRPDRMNAYTRRMGRELNEYIREYGDDDSIRAIIVTGAGDRAFCAGADMGSGGKTFDNDARKDEPDRAEFDWVPTWKVPKPIIAAMNGHAVGVGLTIPIQYDMRIVAEDAKLSFAFVQRGISAELSSTWIVPRLIGIARAGDLMMSGRTILGKEAAELGLVNEALPKDQVLPRAHEIAQYIKTRCAPVSVALTKRLIWEHLGVHDPAVASKREGEGLWPLGRSADAREGVTAFLEKRDPQWTLKPSADMPEISPVEVLER